MLNLELLDIMDLPVSIFWIFVDHVDFKILLCTTQLAKLSFSIIQSVVLTADVFQF